MRKLVTFRFDTEMLAKARRVAQLENRTLTNLIETIVKQAINGRDGDDPPHKAREDRV
jgi:hypothetical protein